MSAPTVAAQQCGTMDEVAMISAHYAYADSGNLEIAIRAYLTFATPPDAAGLIERLEEGTNGTDITKTDPYLNALMRQAATALRLSAGGGWRSMDSAPKDGTWIWAHRPSKGGGFLDRVLVIRWDNDVGAWVWPDEPFDIYEDSYQERLASANFGERIDPYEDNSFDLWMPIPPLPASPTVEAGHVE